ncbi:MAG: substrate-binding periplasmic protein [Candidatus Tectimicrobiota bacterium]
MSLYQARKVWSLSVWVLALLGSLLSMALSAAAQTDELATKPALYPTPAVNTVLVPTPELLAPEIKAIIDRGVLRVAMTSRDQPPFYYASADGELAGLDVALARDIASRLGVQAHFDRHPQNFKEVVEYVARGDADVGISKLSRTLTRAQMLRFTRPYATFRHAMLFNRLRLTQQTTEEELPTLLRNLKGKIGVIGQSSYEGFLSQYFPQATPVTFTTWDEAVAAVFAGEVLAVYRDELEIQKINQYRQEASLTLKTVIYKDMKDYISMAVAWNRPHLAAWLDVYLDSFPTDYKVADLLRIYGSTKEKP